MSEHTLKEEIGTETFEKISELVGERVDNSVIHETDEETREEWVESTLEVIDEEIESIDLAGAIRDEEVHIRNGPDN